MKSILGVLILCVLVHADLEPISKGPPCKQCLDDPSKKLCRYTEGELYCCDKDDRETPECWWDCNMTLQAASAWRYEVCFDPDLCGETMFKVHPGKKGEKKLKKTLETNSVCIYTFSFLNETETVEFDFWSEDVFENALFYHFDSDSN